MGLDVFVYKIGKIPENISEMIQGKPTPVDTLRDEFGLSVLSVENYDEKRESAIFPFFTKVRAIQTYWDMEKIWEDYRIPEDRRYMVGGGCGPGFVEFVFSNGKTEDDYQSVTARIHEEDEPKYLIDQESEVYVFTKEEVGHWNKNYPLFRWLKAHLLEACVKYEDRKYFPVDDEMLFMMQHLDELTKKSEFFKDDDFCTPANYLEDESSMEPVALSPGEGLVLSSVVISY